MAKKIRSAPARGPLRAHPANPRYFTDGSGRAVYLAGSHSWNNFRDRNPGDPPPPFDYQAFLDFQQKFNHNFFRLWAWELPRTYQVKGLVWHSNIFPWPRTGPGLATDGKPTFDLKQFVPEFFERMRQRVIAAGELGIYVCVMLFDGFGPQHLRQPDDGFPFEGANNINGINCGGKESQSLVDPAVTALQEAYVRKVIDTVNDLDNVLYEIANEAGVYSMEWQYHMIRFVKKYEAAKPQQHPVGMTAMYAGGTNQQLWDSPADWISPDGTQGYGIPTDPPTADGRKVVINDTDHSAYFIGLKEIGEAGQRAWVWKNFLRGYNLAFMDPYMVHWTDRNYPQGKKIDPWWNMLRENMGYTKAFADRMDLTTLAPHNDLASTKYCLADPGKQYLVYLPEGKSVEVDLSGATGRLRVKWFDPVIGKSTAAGHITGGEKRSLNSPFPQDAVLHLAK